MSTFILYLIMRFDFVINLILVILEINIIATFVLGAIYINLKSKHKPSDEDIERKKVIKTAYKKSIITLFLLLIVGFLIPNTKDALILLHNYESSSNANKITAEINNE